MSQGCMFKSKLVFIHAWQCSSSCIAIKKAIFGFKKFRQQNFGVTTLFTKLELHWKRLEYRQSRIIQRWKAILLKFRAMVGYWSCLQSHSSSKIKDLSKSMDDRVAQILRNPGVTLDNKKCSNAWSNIISFNFKLLSIFIFCFCNVFC